MIAGLVVSLAALVAFAPLGATGEPEVKAPPKAKDSSRATDIAMTPGTLALREFKQQVPATAFEFTMVAVPADVAKGIKAFYIAKTELTWEAFDVWVYSLDEVASESVSVSGNGGGGSESPPADAVTRPSKPYLPPDRGFGHEGYAAICVSFQSAQTYCKWLSSKTGRNYRLPTASEWEHAARADTADGPYAGGASQPQILSNYAWYEANSDGKAHPVGSRKANAWGLVDMLGNVAEWAVSADGKGVTKGGSWRDAPEKLTIEGSVPASSSWNSSDPQVPKSKWWLADGPFVGFRVVCEVGPALSPQPEQAEQTEQANPKVLSPGEQHK